MRKVFWSSTVVACLLLAELSSGIEINTTLVHHTYRITGPANEPNKVHYGTVFLMAIPDPNAPERGLPVIITADHVLQDILGESATIYLREKLPDNSYRVIPSLIQIRENDKPLWTSHPIADVAVIKIKPPLFVIKQSEEVPFLTTDWLADDDMIEKYEIHIGDQLLCLGYPLGKFANTAGFSILRSGRIASYPLTPANDIKTFLFDFEVFEGNSGGPVYFSETGRLYDGTYHLGNTSQFVAGIVVGQARENMERLGLASVVPAHFIKETLDILINADAK